jgi:hypothetical protein
MGLLNDSIEAQGLKRRAPTTEAVIGAWDRRLRMEFMAS